MRPAPGAVRMGWPRRARLFEVVAKTATGRFLWHENTTLLLLFSGAIDAGAKAPNMARRSWPARPAGYSRRRLRAAKAGRIASTLTHRRRRTGRLSQYPERREIGELISGRAALHDGRRDAGAEWVGVGVVFIADMQVFGKDNMQFVNMLRLIYSCVLLRGITSDGK